MPDAATLIAAMQARGAGLKSLGYRLRFDLSDTGESILLDATGGRAELTEASGEEEADTVLRLSATSASPTCRPPMSSR